MVHIETVDLSARGVTLPGERVGMVIAQPYLLLTDAEPYKCTPAVKTQQLQVLTDTLNVALDARHGEPKTHFTVFPEYSIPGPDGIALVEASLRSAAWPTGTIVIGGTDALSKGEFATLAGEPGTHLDTVRNCLDRIGGNEWINCGITWVKAQDGTVERWLQPKLFPAWPEQDVLYHGMFRGNSVFTFNGSFDNGTQYRFCSLVCIDWVATLNGQKAWRSVMDDLRQQAAQARAELSLSWLFVIQCNRKPSADSFLTEVSGFFDQTAFPNVRRDRACLVFANSAGKSVPGRADLYGGSSMVFSGQTLFEKPRCGPTFSSGGARFRSSTLLAAYHDIFFRERGACIHSFAQTNPNSLNAGAAGKTIALRRAYVFPLNSVTDPRAPGGEVPACVKWLNDELDNLPSLSIGHPTAPLVNQVDAAHQVTVGSLRALRPQSAHHAVKLAAQESPDALHEDEWDKTESDAITHLVHTLDILGVSFPTPTVGTDPSHATILVNNKTVDILVIRGFTHESCIEHSKKFLGNPQRQVLLVSRDRDNTRWLRRFGTFLQPKSPTLDQEPKITDPSSGALNLGYQNLLEVFLSSTAAAAIEGGVRAELAA
jgi:hypothetical protein